MVFLKPHIIKSSNQIEALTNQKYMDIKKLYERPTKGGTLLFPQEQKKLPTDIAPTQHLNSEVSKPVSPKESK